MTTAVTFRVWLDDGGVLALFPEMKERSPGMCLSYEHNGQHGSAEYAGCMAVTRAATPKECVYLKAELERAGYALAERPKERV